MLKKIILPLLLVQISFAQQLIDGIAAVVGDEIILKSEITNLINQYLIQNRIQADENPKLIERVRQQTVNSLIEQKLMLIQAEKDTIEVDPELLDQRVEQRLRFLIERVGSEDQLEKAFQSPMRKIRKDLRKVIEEQLLVEQTRSTRFRDIKISRREVEDFYNNFQDSLPKLQETVTISHILKIVKPSQEAQVDAFKKITEIKEMLQNGADFAELAEKYSDDPASAKRGGDLGLISRGDFVNEYETVAFGLNDGEVSDIVQTQFGFHIIKMDERRGEKIRTRHILVQVTPTEEDEQRTIEELNQLRERALAGEDFSELAMANSDDENVKNDKGLLGTFEIEKLAIPEFKEIVNELEIGEISKPFKTDFGYHIVKLNDRQKSRPVSLEEDWQRVEEIAYNYKLDKEYKAWIEKLKNEIPIDLRI